MVSAISHVIPSRFIRLLRQGLPPALLLLLLLAASPPARGQLTTEPEKVDFGTITLGTSAVDSVVIFNTGLTTLLVNTADLIGRDVFHILPLNEVTLPSSAFVSVRITFEPPEEGCFEDTLLITWNQVTTRVPVLGCAVDRREGQSGRFVLDGGGGSVGDTVTSRLTLLLDPADLSIVHPERLDYSIQFDPDALWPVEVRASGGIDQTIIGIMPSDGLIRGTLLFPQSFPFSPEHLILEVDWIGLSTGKPINEVGAILRGSTDSQGVRVDTTVTGYLLLDGCTVDSPPFTRRIAARSVSVDPERRILQVDLVMPQGSRVEFGVVDMGGRRTAIEEVSRERVDGTDEDPDGIMRVRFDLAPIARGVHAVEVRLGSDRLTIPFLRP